MELRGTSAFVTGGTSGLGAAVSAMLSASGAAVVTLSRTGPRTHPGRRPDDTIHCLGDVTDPAAVQAALDRAAASAPLRSVVLCAGGGTPRRTINRTGAAQPIEQFRRVIETNLVGTYNCVRLAAATIAMQTRDGSGANAAMVLTSSLAAVAGQAGQAAYAAAKGGVEALVLPVARDLAPLGIRVNAVRPGGFATAAHGDDDAVRDVARRVAGRTAFPARLGRCEEFASLVRELLINDYLNGTTVEITAGMRDLPR